MSPLARVATLLLSLFDTATHDLRRFVRLSLPGGQDLVLDLPGPSASARHLTTEAVVVLDRRGLLGPPLFHALRAEFPAREPDIDAVQQAITAASSSKSSPTAPPRQPPADPAEVARSLTEAAALLRTFVDRVESEGVSLGLWEVRGQIEALAATVRDAGAQVLGAARFEGVLAALEQASASRQAILVGTDTEREQERLGLVLMAAAYAERLARDLDPAGAPPDAPDAPDQDAPAQDEAVLLEAPERSREQLLEDEDFAWRIANEDEDVGEAPVALEGPVEPAVWPADADSVDYHHLAGTPDGGAFSVSAQVLRSLVQANHFQPVRNTLVVVGLRGCILAGDADHHDLTDAVECLEVRPDHVHLRCTLFLWDTRSDRIAAFRGSTVPNRSYLTTYIRDRSPRANMLLTGAYHYVTGTHRGMPGALSMAQPAFRVLRPVLGKEVITLTRRDRFDGPAAPPDNIHPAFRAPTSEPAFGSAGCQTVQGNYSKSTGQRWGPWAVFQQRAGLLTRGRHFDYVLLTGREARLAAAHPDVDLWRLRFGSKGAEVRTLQRALGIGVDGDFGPGTQGAVLRRQAQLADDSTADGIVTRAWLEGLGG